jgi:transposase
MLLSAGLILMKRRQFGPRNEAIDVDQLGLFASDASTVVAVVEQDSESDSNDDQETNAPVKRQKAIRILKDLPREVRIIDIPDTDKVCGCCGKELHRFGEESSKQLHYVPASLKIIETRRQKYACGSCHGEIKRAQHDRSAPLVKGMASASLLAYLIVSKFSDGLPLYRIAQRLSRLGIELSHTLMSSWLVQCSELLEDLHDRMITEVLAAGHVFTDDTILPLQNHDPARRTTINARLWVYARSGRRHQPLVYYEFTKDRTQQGPLSRLKDYQGYVQADAFPGYDRLYTNGTIKEVACMVHARRKFVEVTELMKQKGRAHEALRFIARLYRIERQIKALNDADRCEQRRQRSVPVLNEFKAWLDMQVNAVLPKSAMGTALHYALKNWQALYRYTEQGYLEPDNNFAEQCLRPVAVGRKAFLFVGSERAGKAAAIYYSLMESCKLNKVNPLTYMTYVLSNVHNKQITLKLPHEFNASATDAATVE